MLNLPNRVAIGALALLAGAAASIAQSGVTVAYRKVIISDDPGQTGWAGDFDRLNSPAINEGADVAFEGDTNVLNGRGVWFGDFNGFAYSVSRIAQEGDSFMRFVSDGGGSGVQTTFTLNVAGFPSTPEGSIGFSRPLIDNAGRVAFIGSIDSPDEQQGEAVLWLTDASGSPSVIAGAPYLKEPTTGDEGNRYFHRWFNAAGSEIDYANRDHIAMPLAGDGTLAWFANLDTIAELDQSVLPPFTLASGMVRREGGIFFGADFSDHAEIVRYQDPLPGPSVSYGDLNALSLIQMSTPVFNMLGDAAFLSQVSDGRNALTVYDESAGMTPDARRRLIAIDEDELPGTEPGSEGFVPFAPAINQSGAVAFRAVTVAPDGTVGFGLWAEDANLTLGKVLLTTDPVPNFPAASWKLFGDPVLNMNFEKAFVGRHERDVNGTPVTTEGVYWASNTNFLQRVAESGQTAPLVPNTTDLNRHVGKYLSFSDPLMNDTGNVVFHANIDVTDATLVANLGSLGLDPLLIREEAIFVRDDFDTLRTIVSSGMTVDDLLGNGDNRVIINLRFSSDFSRIDQSVLPVREGNGSGHQDGRRTGTTNRVTVFNGEENCQRIRVAFSAELATPGDPDAANIDEGVFVAELLVCEESGCTSCLCSTDPDCLFGSMTLGAGPDFDQSGVVDDTDLNLMMMAWGYTEGRFDMNKDGIVGEKDLALLMEDYGKTVETK